MMAVGRWCTATVTQALRTGTSTSTRIVTTGDDVGDRIDPFAVLGVDETATAEQIQAAYRARAKALHPDLTAGDEAHRDAAEAAMAALTAARWVLTAEATRAQYQGLRPQRRKPATDRGGASRRRSRGPVSMSSQQCRARRR